MAGKPAKEKYITVCPKCGSTDISFEKDPIYAATGLMTQFKQCDNCGYHGMVFPEVPASKARKNPNVAKEIKNVPRVQTAYGQGYMKVVTYVIFPLLTILVIMYLLSRIG